MDLFLQTLLAEYAGFFFIPLVSRLTSDESPKCRKLTALAVKCLLGKVRGKIGGKKGKEGGVNSGDVVWRVGRREGVGGKGQGRWVNWGFQSEEQEECEWERKGGREMSSFLL